MTPKIFLSVFQPTHPPQMFLFGNWTFSAYFRADRNLIFSQTLVLPISAGFALEIEISISRANSAEIGRTKIFEKIRFRFALKNALKVQLPNKKFGEGKWAEKRSKKILESFDDQNRFILTRLAPPLKRLV